MSDPFTAAVTIFLASIPASLALGMFLVRPKVRWVGGRRDRMVHTELPWLAGHRVRTPDAA